ncbi:class I SAM-dependent methyltransferase [Rhizobacter sp. Root1221]|uniref:class I SAM-dependent methyltransferase n=1 Tax=Rhizobacter sp. Root1221 TaxID=1736433 RepID=UPI0006FD9DF2|nr:class I SAM-dependent methyltransferase [Rhizobacter sp. Root1221]KQV95936.1 hypothetical protein ASC87_05215 [Rhizobacter sp. Root1221]
MTSAKDQAKHPDYAVRGLNRERLAALLQHAGQEILDVGCGNGNYVLHLADRYKIRGVDYKHFAAWDQKPHLFAVSDAQRLDVPDASVDTILSFETLEHLPDPDAALREYLRVCRRNLILTVPNCSLTHGQRASGQIYNHWIDRTHINFWELDTLCQQVEAAGFKVDQRNHINHMNMGPIAMEALGLGGRFARFGAKVFNRLQRTQYPMTCLVVASKPKP